MFVRIIFADIDSQCVIFITHNLTNFHRDHAVVILEVENLVTRLFSYQWLATVPFLY